MRPEDKVRDALIKEMETTFGFPRRSLVIEKGIKTLPHILEEKIPNRRIDILSFAKEIHPLYPLYPLLLIECKKDRIDEKAIQQVIGYNAYVKAYFIGLASKDQVILGWKTGDSYMFQEGLMHYDQLIEMVKNVRSSL